MMNYIFDKLGEALDKIMAFRRDRRELADNALRSVSHALNETYLYYARYDRSGPDKDTEAQLSRYWAAAAIPLRHIDPEFAMICENKSEYWTNPEHFSDKDIKKFGIGLADVRQRYRTRLFPGRRLVSGKKKPKKSPQPTPRKRRG
jgi:hypothetical protein